MREERSGDVELRVERFGVMDTVREGKRRRRMEGGRRGKVKKRIDWREGEAVRLGEKEEAVGEGREVGVGRR